MQLYYYFIVGFGVLLLAFVLFHSFRTKKLVSPYSTNRKKRSWISLINYFKDLAYTWFGYFAGSERSKLTRNIIISVLVSIGLFILNKLYFGIDTYVFTLFTILLIIVAVWAIGRHHSRKIFEESFPEVIQTVNSGVSAGIGLLQTLERCGDNIHGEFGAEFKSVYRRLSIGEDVDSVFYDSYRRYPYKEYYYFITIIKLNLSRGGQLKEVISRLSRVIADSKKMEKRKKALTSEARMSAMIVSSFPIGFMVFMRIMMPADFDFLINNPDGRLIFYYVLGSELLGIFIIWLLMRKST